MNTIQSNEPDDSLKSDGAAMAYQKPRLRKIQLAAEEVLSTGCKIAGVCDQLGYSNPTGAGS